MNSDTMCVSSVDRELNTSPLEIDNCTNVKWDAAGKAGLIVTAYPQSWAFHPLQIRHDDAAHH